MPPFPCQARKLQRWCYGCVRCLIRTVWGQIDYCCIESGGQALYGLHHPDKLQTTAIPPSRSDLCECTLPDGKHPALGRCWIRLPDACSKTRCPIDMLIAQPRVSSVEYTGSFDTKNLARISFNSIFTGNSPDGQRRGLNDASADPAVHLELSQCL